MNNVKNLVILVLSAIVILQAGLLLYFLRRSQAPVRKKPVVARPAPLPAEKLPVVRPQEAEPVSPVAERPKPRPEVVTGKIALIIDDWGYNMRNKSFLEDDDMPVTIAILPFQEYSREAAELAHRHGKEVIIHMPMEPHHKEQYGLETNTLLTTMDSSQIVSLMDEAFAQIPYAKGINNHMGSKATEDTRVMRIVIGYLKRRGLFFVDSMVTPKSVGRTVAKSMHEKFASRDIFIDNENGETYIREQLVKVARLAKQNGVAVAIGHDRPHTVAVLKEMIPAFEEQGYEFIGISEVIKDL
ncbi:MAG: divergent polysaccharide deacetylase family protein [Candidatus Omnitrophica bacterium]|nr:divergent polysaccharide deacetylase family protein [Candidatus Omnitrophota bacterium]MDD5573955.1 divergent polysaccharide deacetylase family protein [Candidatus Omnitrophota bacterium]